MKFVQKTLGAAVMTATAGSAMAGVTFEDGDKYLKIGGRIQMQYHISDPDDGNPLTIEDKTDEMLFRRFRPYIEGSLHKDWKGKFQWDMGKAEDDNEIAIKDAYMEYKGIKGLKIRVGNANFPFSRELLTSSKKQQLVERSFVGDHNYGTPDRNTGLHIVGKAGSMFDYAASYAQASIDPDDAKLDFDTPVNMKDDWNEGWMAGGRIEFAPLGRVKFAQGDFSRKLGVSLGVGAYSWSNDEDNATYTDLTTNTHLGGSKVDLDKVSGTEVSLAVRGYGLSLDAQQNVFKAETIDATYTGGIYVNGETKLSNTSVEAGYMVVPGILELVVGKQTQEDDDNAYAEKWKRTSYGINYFIKKQDIKIQLTVRDGENLDGVLNNDEKETFLQTQYVF